ncbi:hypothetical protein AABB24_013563 [Solanum stoloniferum]|uniref:Uncharacterized protein n=1 Tax=Solanum stoloniferum TaxID=62892 RepID=A0ABD2UBA2_9SOLN
MGICYSSSKSKSDDGLWDDKNDSRRFDSKLKKNSYSGDFSTFLSKLSGVGGGGGEDKGLHHIPGRILGNGASSRACLHTQQGKKGTNQDAMIVWEFMTWLECFYNRIFAREVIQSFAEYLMDTVLMAIWWQGKFEILFRFSCVQSGKLNPVVIKVILLRQEIPTEVHILMMSWMMI